VAAALPAAGIGRRDRRRRGNFSVTQAWFCDSEQNILTGDDPPAR